jgi:hypothetical protein
MTLDNTVVSRLINKRADSTQLKSDKGGWLARDAIGDPKDHILRSVDAASFSTRVSILADGNGRSSEIRLTQLPQT